MQPLFFANFILNTVFLQFLFENEGMFALFLGLGIYKKALVNKRVNKNI